jgi:phosphoribosylformylglycinamidine cyclo-ligase
MPDVKCFLFLIYLSQSDINRANHILREPHLKKSSRRHSKKDRIDYKDSGVDVVAGDALVDWLADDKTETPHKSQIISGIGGFASLFRLNTTQYKKPCLVTCTDGVGTKVLLAVHAESYKEVAQDMVAMCVNDLITTGADPLMFLDYYATSKLDLKAAQEFLTGVKEACLKSDCALVGGETAEMPGVYKDKDFDCAGFAVGIVDEDQRLGSHLVKAGDAVIGISSNGFHSNGYSLLRKAYAKDLAQNLEMLLRPTHLYVEFSKKIRELKVHALAHITGGGMENIPRVLPKGLGLNLKSWAWPKEFLEVQKRTGMSDQQMLETLNCGIGFVVICSADDAGQVSQIAKKLKFTPYDLGTIEKQSTPLTYPKGKKNA